MLDDNDSTTPATEAGPGDPTESPVAPAKPVAKKVTRKRAVKKTVTTRPAEAPASRSEAMASFADSSFGVTRRPFARRCNC